MIAYHGNVPNLTAVIKSFGKEERRRGAAFEKGLVRGGLFIQRESQKIVPVEFGVLKNSARTRRESRRYRTVVSVSYNTDYAVFVHEDLEARHRPGKTAKFLEIPIRRHGKRIVSEIAMEVRRA